MLPSSPNGSARLRVLLGVSGGIAAWKSLELVRLFDHSGWDTTVVMTRAARHFVGVESFAALTGNPVACELFPRHRPARRAEWGRVEHVDLASQAGLVVVAPATANILGKLANGIADDLLSTLLLAVPESTRRSGRLILAPAMNNAMWLNPAVQANIARLRQTGCRIVGPDSGELACGTVGPGRMAEPAEIFAACRQALTDRSLSLAGRSVTVTAGRTEEPIDPVRIITNRSSGRLGCAVADACAAAGADVTLIAGALSVTPPPVKVLSAPTAEAMRLATIKLARRTDVLVMCAAVADYRPGRPERTKLHSPTLRLTLERTPGILAEVAKLDRRPLTVGFSQDNSLARARAKLHRYRLNLIVANPTGTAGSDTIRPTVIWADGRSRRFPSLPKTEFAQQLVGLIAELCAKGTDNAG